MASEIQLTSQDNSEINLTLNESPSSIDVNFQEGSTINSVVQEPSVSKINERIYCSCKPVRLYRNISL